MAKTSKATGIDIYYNKSKIKWIVLVVSVLISVASIYYTDILVDQLKERERKQIELFAKALEYTANESLDNNIYFITDQILFENNSIPTILITENGEITGHRNIEIDSSASQVQMNQQLYEELEEMRDTYEPIEVKLRDPNTNEIYEVQYVYYKNSFLLTQLIYYPYVQLSVISLFAFIVYLIFNYSKAAEQNRVWVGLAKETAHQLGTPISSLMAWVEYFKDQAQIEDKNLFDELDKDIKKLQVITERFSNIGSTPVLSEENVEVLIKNIIDYLKPRISPKVNMTVDSLTPQITAMINPPLFEWVIENLCKNAVDAMSGSGSINIYILKGSDHRVFVDITDTGKGIPKSKIRQVFSPGFTTKKRGWGLGLTLAKRIIEIYHQGKIFVKSSEENQGTTFRIVLHT
ncbi:HAMP domain-containing sensor histidine kinase [Fulvivirga kasyanovii]|uniref:histidine kinase n=1 Tax=Fulvivirga kasyanovii TaxID=396812 RepID=A0ABW9RPR5_9BACT|nr:HAMP domain-containing sensor histidine kinase [Fulvivirga kasyanovii]MTI26132.1 HAMP domain-containing histidine kinase [Fulvivirga kasyanovii]